MEENVEALLPEENGDGPEMIDIPMLEELARLAKPDDYVIDTGV